jgi:nicotinate-nucleotide adenylyltransferase
VVLYGGTFDPVHLGHLHLAISAQKAFPDAKIVFLPAGLSPGKTPPLAPPHLRRHWLELAAQAHGLSVWETELARSGPSFTVDTLAEAHRLGARRDRLFLLMGSDSYAAFSRWKEPEKIRSLCRLLLVLRPGSAAQALESDDLLLEVEPNPNSSSAIRKALAAKQSLAGKVPPAVLLELEKLSSLGKNPYNRKPE